MSRSSRVLNWVQTLSDIESSRKRISVLSFKYKNWQKLFRSGLKSKTKYSLILTNNWIFSKFLLNIKPRYIWWYLPVTISSLQACFKHVTWLDDPMKILDFYHAIFSRWERSGKWLFTFAPPTLDFFCWFPLKYVRILISITYVILQNNPENNC